MADLSRSPTGIITKERFAFVAGGAAGDLTVTGIRTGVGDRIVQVWAIGLTEAAPPTFSGIEDLTSEFSITASDTINNAAGTATTGKLVFVRWYDADWGERTQLAQLA